MTLAPSKITADPCNYVVAFIDLLGQGDQFQKLSAAPYSFTTSTLEKDTLKDSVGGVLSLRQNFSTFFNEINKPSGIIDQLPPVQKAEAERYFKRSILSYGVSDSFINAVPLVIERNPVPLFTVYSVLYATCIMSIDGLSRGYPIRGGIDVGIGVEIDNREVYGYPVWSAYNLESKKAEYPRILIGDSFWKYVTERSRITVDSLPTRIERDFALKCLTLIDKAVDGKRILDVLGTGMLSVQEKKTAQQVAKAYDFVVNEQKRFAAEGDKRLLPRYTELKRYFDSRLELWDLPQSLT